MAKWEGFSEEDIKRIRASDRFEEGQPLNSPTRQAAKRQPSISQSAARSRMLQKSREGTEMSNEITDIPKTAFLSNSQEQTVKEVKRSDESQLLSADSGCGTTPNTSPSHGAVCLRIKEGKSYEVLSGSPGSLDEFQARQRLMEEQNRLKKELLAKKLADRKKQTTAEAHRLQQIQDELQKLDLLLSNDVSILRDQIEVASHDFMEAQKRYSKAEKEFLEAKLLLFDKLERKEMLTEHLCTIIEQNEIRKARKLSELMDKLDIGALAKEVEEEEHKNVPKNEILSPLCALDEVSYAACSTLKPRKELGKPDGAAAKEKEDSAHLPQLPESEKA